MYIKELPPSPQENFWNSIDEDSQESLANRGDLSSGITYEDTPKISTIAIQPEEIAKRLLAYVTGSRE